MNVPDAMGTEHPAKPGRQRELGARVVAAMTGFYLTAMVGFCPTATAAAADSGAGADIALQQPGALLPLQDRVGHPAVAAAVEDALRETLASYVHLVDPVRLRDAQRRQRLRDASQATPQALAGLAEETSARWFFSATLHEASQRQQSRAARAFESERQPQGPVPQITLSARVVHPVAAEPAAGGGGGSLAWVGFEAASGLDDRRLLGLGVIDDPELLGRRVAQRLVDSFARTFTRDTPRPATDRPNPGRPARGGFLRQPLSVHELGTVALVPFLSVTDRNATRSGETASELALAVLYRHGVRLVAPGRVNQILRRRGALPRGEIDAETRAALRSEAGAERILTGTVEAWEVAGRGGEPEPLIAFSARLLDADTGRILWWNGQDRGGWDHSQLLGTGRIFAAGRLAENMMQSLVASFLAPVEPRGTGP